MKFGITPGGGGNAPTSCELEFILEVQKRVTHWNVWPGIGRDTTDIWRCWDMYFELISYHLTVGWETKRRRYQIWFYAPPSRKVYHGRVSEASLYR